MFRTLLRRWSKPSTRPNRAGLAPQANDQRLFLPGRSSGRQSGSQAPRLDVVVCVCAHEVIVCIKGEAGYAEAGSLEAALLPVEARRPPLVTFDLSELHFLSSLVLGILVAYQRSARRRGGRVRLLGLQPPVRETIDCARLTSLFEEVDASEVLKDPLWT
jgi:anti-anti-sigma factor